MNHIKFSFKTGLMSILAVLFAMALVGCSEEATAPTMDLNSIEASTIALDPLANVLDSTDGSTPGDPTAKINRLAEVLGLDEAQKEALLVAYTEFWDARAALRDQVIAGEITLEEARDQCAVLREAFEAELQLILTAEQYEMLQDLRRYRHRNETGECDKYQIWGDLLEEIGADSMQTVEVFEALDILHDGIKNLFAQVKEGTLTREEAIEAALLLRDGFDAALQAILTAEQYEALLALRPDKCEN